MRSRVILRCAAVWLSLGLGSGQAAELSLSEAVRIALENRPELEAAGAGIDAASGAVTQASLKPNPVLSIQTENWRFYGHPSFSVGQNLDVFAYVSQSIETGGKRESRVEVAEGDKSVAELHRAALAWEIRRQVRLAWWRAAAADGMVRQLNAGMEAYRDLVRYHEIRWQEGAGAEIDLIKVRLEEQKASTALATAKLASEQARSELYREMGISSPPNVYEVGVDAAGLMKPIVVPTVDALAAQALQSRPEVLIQQSRIERADAETRLSLATAKPNVTPYVGYKRSSGFNTLVGGVSVPLTVRDRNQGEIERTRAELRREKALLAAVENQIRAEINQAAATLARRAELLDALQSGILTQAQQSYDIAFAAYQEDAADLLFVLDARRSLNEVMLMRSQALFDYQLAAVELEAAIGKQLDEETGTTGEGDAQ